MHRIFAGMAAWAVIFIVAEGVLGILTKRVEPALDGWHMVFGVFVGIYVSILHIMVMFHFIGSGKELKEAAQVLGENADVVRRVALFKKHVFPFATFAPLVVGASVILGGGVHTESLPGWVHWGLGLAGLALNLYAFPIEYRALVANLELLREVDERIKREVSPGFYNE